MHLTAKVWRGIKFCGNNTSIYILKVDFRQNGDHLNRKAKFSLLFFIFWVRKIISQWKLHFALVWAASKTITFLLKKWRKPIERFSRKVVALFQNQGFQKNKIKILRSIALNKLCSIERENKIVRNWSITKPL